MKLKNIIQWIIIGIVATGIDVFIILSEMNIKFSGWYVLIWIILANSTWAIDLVWRDNVNCESK